MYNTKSRYSLDLFVLVWKTIYYYFFNGFVLLIILAILRMSQLYLIYVNIKKNLKYEGRDNFQFYMFVMKI